jgi:mutator protein MutT
MIEVAAGLVFRQGEVLITQRPAQGHLGGLWEFPGGKREPAETWEACLRRELMEELGIEVVVGELLESSIHAYPDQTVQLQFYRCRLLRNEPRPLGCQTVAWVNADQLGNYGFPAADAGLLDRLRSTPELWHDP